MVSLSIKTRKTMIITKPDVNPEGFYNLSQTARALHVDRHTVARYAAQGYIHFKRRKLGRVRVTTGAEIIKCWKMIYHQ